MQPTLLLICLTIVVSSARAQQQERKLIDRLLRPDLSLVNPAQGKRYVGAEASSLQKEFETKRFPTGNRVRTKAFSGTTEFLSPTFATRESSQSQRVVRAHAQSRYAAAQFATRNSSLIKAAPDAEKNVKGHTYVESRRPFLAQGTRQKILSRHNHPLTIEEVRELLNRAE
jgi:hypothetical protein